MSSATRNPRSTINAMLPHRGRLAKRRVSIILSAGRLPTGTRAIAQSRQHHKGDPEYHGQCLRHVTTVDCSHFRHQSMRVIVLIFTLGG
jgi:hypothetical protein